MARARLVLALTAALCAFPATASAGVVTGTLFDAGTPEVEGRYQLDVRFEANPGEPNDLVVTITGEDVVFEDAGAEIEVRGQCRRTAPHRAVCESTRGGLGSTRVALGDGDDRGRIDVDTEFRPISMRAGPGDDVVRGGIAFERLGGGAGNDLVDGGSGGDTINGGGGRDELRAGDIAYGYDFITDGDTDRNADGDKIVGHAEAWETVVSYRERREPVMVSLEAGVAGSRGEGDSFTGIRHVEGGRGDDVLRGTNENDFIRGNDGADVVRGEGGDDLLSGQRGPDRVYGGSGNDTANDDSDDAVDIQNCGPGADWVSSSDARDRLRGTCEDGAWGSIANQSFDSRITAHPVLTPRRAVFRSTCREFPKCSGRIRLVSPGARRPLGRGRFEFRAYRGNDPEAARRHEIVVGLNERGRERVGRGGYVRVVIVSRYDCQGCLNPPPPTKTGFTVWMRR